MSADEALKPALRGLKHGPLDGRSVHLCVDMQRLFAPDGPWPTPWMDRTLPVIARVAEAVRERTIFTRFIPPREPDDLPGMWRCYYRRWRDVTLARLDPCFLDLVPPLAALADPARVVDKRLYSPWFGSALPHRLQEMKGNALVVTGAETDVCVLATVLGAVDHGFRVVVAADAICSSSDAGHDAMLTLYRERYSEQIEVAETDEILENWRQ